MKKYALRSLLLLTVLLFVLAACGGEEAAPTAVPVEDAPEPTEVAVEEEPEPVNAEANVDEIEVLLLESFPVQVNVIASGNLPNGCTTLDEPTPRLEGNTFVINLTTTRLDEICTEAVVPFDKVIPLDVEGLSAGTYTVAVNGLGDTFTLETDNVIQEEPTPTSVPPDDNAEGGVISGIVWHDLCAVAGGEGEEPAVPSDGCVALEDGSYEANGLLEVAEPGLEDVVVSLGEGACPASDLDSTTTGPDGSYTFTGLAAGTYCVSVDALTVANSTILVPGDWTAAPEADDATAVASAEVTLTADDEVTDIDFGWDYQFLPSPDGVAESGEGDGACSDQAEFVADVTVLDNEILPPGYAFTKTWRLQNIGTCTWSTDYDLIFARGDQLGAPDAVPLPTSVAPEQAIDVSVQMESPELNGTYRGDWQLRNAEGERFGIPGEVTFWVLIEVTAAFPAEGSTISGFLWGERCNPVAGATTAPDGCVADEDGDFLGNAFYDANEPRLDGITVALEEGECPATSVTATAITDEAGRFVFNVEEAGTYCVFVNALAGDNEDLLGAGTWTFPEVADETISTSVEVVLGESVGDINFAYDPE